MQGPPELPKELLEDIVAYARATGSSVEDVLEELLRVIAAHRNEPEDHWQPRRPATPVADPRQPIRAAR